jgi:hypothetical protein
VFVDDARLLKGPVRGQEVVIVALDSNAAHEIEPRQGAVVRDLVEYSSHRFESYDELYQHFAPAIRARFEPKDSLRQSRYLFEALWDDILASMIGVHYLEHLIGVVLAREQPARIEYAIADRDLDALVRLTVENLS